MSPAAISQTFPSPEVNSTEPFRLFDLLISYVYVDIIFYKKKVVSTFISSRQNNPWKHL